MKENYGELTARNDENAGFRKQFVHPNSNHAGYLEMDGCVVVDMLPR